MYEELREMNNEIKRKQEYIAELRALATSMTMTLSERVQTSPEDRLSNLMCKIIMAENELDTMVDEFADLKVKTKSEIFTLPYEDWQDILYMHYIEFKPFSDIADIKNISINAVKKRNQRALKYLKK
jgi:DNA-directed RNA polymerase specialized sigma subunit